MEKMTYVILGVTGGIGRKFLNSIINNNNIESLIILSRTTNHIKLDSENSSIIKHVYCDLSKMDSVSNACNILKNMARIDYFINMAGMAYHCPIDDIELDDLIEVFSINAVAPILLLSKLIPLLDKSKSPTIINVTSILASKGMKYTSSYTASKHALDGYTKVLRIERPNYKIVNIEPGAVETAFIERTKNKKAIDFFSRRKINKIPPEEVANIITLAITSQSELECVRVTPIEQNI